jgi:tRNA-specific 2-thiouridylase
MTNSSKIKVFVGLSGGVDSSVAAALLQQQGYEVTGVFIKVWQADFLPCTWREERLDAMRVCAHLGIPFLTFDFEYEYKREVVDYMIAEYRAGRTPNPDVMCNRHVKFGAFWREACRLGADIIATGHYAQIESAKQSSGNKKNRSYRMLTSADTEKDQTYFLWTLTQSDLSHVFFPVGGLKKSQVRKLAAKFGLPTAEKKDSQGLCFMGHVDMKDFLKHYLPEASGKVLDEQGNIIGTHDGAVFYTIGQRHGFRVTNGFENKPLYIIAKDIKKNILTVSDKIFAPKAFLTEISNIKSVFNPDGKIILIENIVWNAPDVPLESGKEYSARIRYRQPLVKCSIVISASDEITDTNTDLKKHVLKVIFSEPQTAPASGQSLVFYSADGKRCLGGGIIC